MIIFMHSTTIKASYTLCYSYTALRKGLGNFIFPKIVNTDFAD